MLPNDDAFDVQESTYFNRYTTSKFSLVNVNGFRLFGALAATVRKSRQAATRRKLTAMGTAH